jgi:UDP-N-acetylmuramoyl-L-alanyl-D-glutamate--2,6-diaminopimelate ligase
MRKFAPQFLLSWYHFGWAVLGAVLYGFPARNMRVIGVTGTNGKSTTVEMISRILREAGFKTASLSSIRFQINEKEWRNKLKMTMPGRFVIQRFLRQAVDAGCTHAVIEVTSEGILQHRHRFLNFHTAVFTNLSPEHIERHGSFEKYREAKGELFKVAKKVHVINADDPNAQYFLQFPAKTVITYSLADAKDMDLHLKLLGTFNISNALAATAVAKNLGISSDISKRALERIEGVPGRMELVVKEPFRVVVDYAFTPAALEKVYQTFRENSKFEIRNSKLICVLGAAGGGRDKWKRPVLGKLAATYCDRIIVTNEDPYDEDPMAIIEQVAKGAEQIRINQQNPHESAVFKILDRREAIRKALSFAKPGDTVVITGKGCEDSIAVKGGKKIPWDDREVVREEFRQLDSQSNI